MKKSYLLIGALFLAAFICENQAQIPGMPALVTQNTNIEPNRLEAVIESDLSGTQEQIIVAITWIPGSFMPGLHVMLGQTDLNITVSQIGKAWMLAQYQISNWSQDHKQNINEVSSSARVDIGTKVYLLQRGGKSVSILIREPVR